MSDTRAAKTTHAQCVLWLTVIMLVLSGCNNQPSGGKKKGSFFRGAFRLFQPKPKEPSRPDPNTVWPPHAIWVVRQPYNSPGEISALMERCKQAGFNTVLFQVRGEATAHYRSRIEPFAYEYRSGDPGFDPLEVACREAHRRGLALHAWINVMPAWRGEKPPPDTRHIYYQQPDWFWYDQRGRRQPLGWYVSLNPCLPEVREYLVKICKEIVTKYPVDGLHLDYIRFPTDQTPSGYDYPCDSKTLALYQRATGKRPQDSRWSWNQWRTDRVTQLVGEIRQMMRRKAPSVKLTAACTPDLDEARKHYFQDAPQWVREGLIDLAFVMNYSVRTQAFRQRQEAWRREAGGRRVAVGIGVYLHKTPKTTLDQLALAESWGDGFSLFSNNALLTAAPQARQRLQTIRPTLLMMRDRALARNRKAPPRDEPQATPEPPRSSVVKRRPYGVVP